MWLFFIPSIEKNNREGTRMAFKERVNPKTGKVEYSYRYYFYRDGKKRDSNTAWCSSLDEARREAQRLKKEKEEKENNSILQRRDTLLSTAFDGFIKYYETKATEKTTENTCTANSIWRRAKTIKEKYMPSFVQKTKTKDISTATFREWLTYINDKDLSGNYVRSLKSTLTYFNKWLRDNNYYADDNLDIDIDIALQRTTIKKRNYKNRQISGERNVLTVSEIEMICNYFYKKGLEKFDNFYFYTLFYVLFYSGMRVEELIGLQWKFVHLGNTERTISIENAINQRELKSNVEERIKNSVYHTKNQVSKRIIPIFDFYYELLVDYKNSFKYEYNLSNTEIEECFVFPKLKNHNPYEYQATDRLTIVLHKVIEALGLNNSDCQMLRHSCATFLILPMPEGLGFEEQQVIDYFGHTDTEMLKSIYAKITKEQKAKRMANTFSEYFKPDKSLEQTKENNTQTRLIERMKGKNIEAEEKRKERIFNQIEKAIKKNQENYYYLKKDKWVIEYFQLEKPELFDKIIFIEE